MNETPEAALNINKIIVDLTRKFIANSAGSVYRKSRNIFKGLSSDARLARRKNLLKGLRRKK
jgi:hypothetical protein